MNRREISRGVVPLLAVLLLAGGAIPAGADWLVTREGGRVEIQGKPQVKGKLVVFTRADGTLSSLRLSEVDLEASERVTAEEKEKKETQAVAAQEAVKKKSVASVTDDNLVRAKKPEPAPAAAPAGETAPTDATAPAADTGPATVGTWRQQDLPAGGGIELVGNLENKGDKIATGLSLTVQLYNETGQLLATGTGVLMGGSIPPGGKLDFKVPFPGLFTFSDARFQVKSWPLDLNPVPEAPPAEAPPS